MPERRFELLHLAALVPETSASTSFAIRALRYAPTKIKSKLFFVRKPKIRLLDLFVQGMTLHIRIVLLQDKTFRGVFLVLCRGVA